MVVDHRVTARELLRSIQEERARLEATLARLTAEQILAPGIDGPWSVKDILVHVSYWERDLLRRLCGHYSVDAPTDDINERVFQANRARPIAAVMAEFDASFRALMTRLVELSDEELNRPPFYRPWQVRPLWRDVASETYEHYWEHTEPLRVWLARSARGRRAA
ncbi:MAG TPA: DinB family protein [Chloroflexota bacterium]|jgi:uncharacterized protein (TIGR03083 family)